MLFAMLLLLCLMITDYRVLDMPSERYKGYIKDYDKSLLMECYIHPTIPFTQIKHVHMHQGDFILSRYGVHDATLIK
jgi:hypothetical protein